MIAGEKVKPFCKSPILGLIRFFRASSASAFGDGRDGDRGDEGFIAVDQTAQLPQNS